MSNDFVIFGNSKEFTGTLPQTLAPKTQSRIRTRTRSGQCFFSVISDDTLSD